MRCANPQVHFVVITFRKRRRPGKGQETNSEKEKVVDSNGDGGKRESSKEFEISTEYPPGFTPRGTPLVQEATASSSAHDT
ncbi:hypothetical protein Tco_1139559 [Tanacetum coccineum]